MKTLADGTQVPSRTYYYLLDFNDVDNKEFIAEKFNKHRLCDLNIDEYQKLFVEATIRDDNKLIALL